MNIQQTGASLRPRNRRLISINDELDTVETTNPGRLFHDTTTSSPTAASPVPSTHPSRAASETRQSQASQQNGDFAFSSQVSSGPRGGQPASSSVWGSPWSSFQNIASSLLGNGSENTSSSLRKKRPPELKTSRWFSRPAVDEWGPSANHERHIASGSQEDRLAQVQAKKREALMVEAVNGFSSPDVLGKHKRKTSVEVANSCEPDTSDALVYLHHVKPMDTMAGIAIKFHCSQEVIRKTNRLYANDRVQIRKILYLPVDACGIKGRKISYPSSSVDILGNSSNQDSTLTPTNIPPDWQEMSGSSAKSPYPQDHETSPDPSNNTTETETPWIHDSWVDIHSIPEAVEIARLPRRALGFFPPGRRKSIPYSDLSTPPGSMDISRSPSSPHRQKSPIRRAVSHAPTSSLANMLRGPGGVGTMGVEVRQPGPPPDKLNQLFATHFPSVAPRTSFDSADSGYSNSGGLERLENVGGTIEGWMRKMATKAAQAVSTPPLSGRTVMPEGDLIELVEGWELDGGTNPHTFAATAREEQDSTSSTTTAPTGATAASASSSSRKDEDALLRERFPMRGRVFEDEATKRDKTR